ncbi:MAG: GDSL-type esterase/lipase family protein [Planctomycetota bacterium]
MSSPDGAGGARPRSRLRGLAFSVLALGLGVVLLELTLQGLSAFVPGVSGLLLVEGGGRPTDPRRIPDERIGERPNPDWFDHDARGFRNDEALERAAVVALGDSQTYGTGVDGAEAWPAVLGKGLGEPAYNMGFPGYGPAQMLLLLEDALALEPRVVVAAMYAGNDLYDAYKLVHVDRLGDALGGPSEAERAAIDAAEAETSLVDSVMVAYANRRVGLRGVLSRRCRIYGLLRATQRAFEDKPDPAAREAARTDWGLLTARAAARPGRYAAFEDERFKTLFTPGYRALAVQLDDPRIREGERLCLESIARMAELASEADARLVALFVPTKEYVFAELEREAPAGGETYRKLVADEERLWSEARAFLEERDVAIADGVRALRAPLDRGEQPYPMDHDGHPNALGQRALAEEVQRVIEGLGD